MARICITGKVRDVNGGLVMACGTLEAPIRWLKLKLEDAEPKPDTHPQTFNHIEIASEDGLMEYWPNLAIWEPIETAPKDKRILILERGKYPFLSFWAKFYSPLYRDECEGWWTGSDPSRAHLTLPEFATHWMPVPELPA